MSLPPVTLYLPVFNAAPYLSEAIDSILMQSYNNFEFIIIDDGSVDNSSEIISSFTDSRIRKIKNEINLGIRKTANIALREARGKYIIRMDSDDISLPHRIEEQVDFMEKNPGIGISSCYLQLFGDENGVWEFPITDDECKAGLFWGTTITQPGSIIRTNVIRKNNIFYEESGEGFAEDWEFFYKLRSVTNFGNVGKVLVKYRRHQNNITKKFKEKSYQLNLQMSKRILEDLGIDGTERELSLHLFVNTQIKEKPDKKFIFEARQWLNRLIEHNNKTRFFPKNAFRKICEKKWDKLFFHLVPFGFRTVFIYFTITGISWNHLMYYLKYSVNKIIGRK